MKKLMLLIAIMTILISCQVEQAPQQYFEESPEIEIAKKVIDAYLKQDWATLRAQYSDTARIWSNIWYTSSGISVDKSIEGDKAFVSSLGSYTYEDALWEMIVNNKGDKWVHFWGKWVGKFSQDSTEMVVPVHIDFGFTGDKITQEAGFWDNLPGYLAQEALKNKTK
jgi:hypothetical protein